MAVKIKTDYGTATVKDGRWTASNAFLRDLLKEYNPDSLEEEVGYHPWLDLGIAEMAVEGLGGEVVETTDAPIVEAGVIY